MELYTIAIRARDTNNFGGHYQGHRPFCQLLRPPFRGVGKIVEKRTISQGQTPIDLQEGITGVSTGLQVCIQLLRMILSLAAVSSP